jgi:alpha-glucosidase
VLVFSREPGFVCTVNTGDEPVTVPRPGRLLLASAHVDVARREVQHAAEDEVVLLPPNTTAWWATK